LLMAGKIRKRLDDKAGSLYRKPPWMRQCTFMRLQQRYHQYSMRYELAHILDHQKW
jgi:hypothetical protein